jgi:FtsP/CotA-like multicopper oxidase with cupredoxin domain
MTTAIKTSIRYAVLVIATMVAACSLEARQADDSNDASDPVDLAAEARIEPNDNRRPAGRLVDGVLYLDLEARAGVWRPTGPDGAEIRIGAFAEAGGPPLIPGPLIRVPVGTTVRTSLRNSLDRPLAVFGLGEERGFAGDSVLVAADDKAEFVFEATEPGTYYYVGRTSPRWVPGLPLTGSLHGAIVVDPPGAEVDRGDRILVISLWFTFDPTTFSRLSDDAVIAVNGRAWPHTETVEATVGDSLEWRWVNLTDLQHPMHLHGFHFRVDARGDGIRDTLYAPERRQLAVTEYVGPTRTATTVWSPDRPGNWVFHCHMLSHMTAMEVVNTPVSERAAMRHDMEEMMGMLIVGIKVRPGVMATLSASDEARPIRLLIRSRPGVYGENHGYAYVIGDSPAASDPAALPLPGPALVLRRNERVAINLVNQSHEPAAVHWHGIELESYADGIPGWSGQGDRILPAIPPGDSLTIEFTPPRAGTFMYHSHFNEMQQTSSGLYGPIIVLAPGETLDPETDRVLLFSDGGPWTSFTLDSPVPPTLLNGSEAPGPIDLRVGETYRFRLINILTESSLRVALQRDGEPVSWRAIAKDGADLPSALATDRPAELTFMPGELHDFEFTPDGTGQLELEFGKGAPWDESKRVRVEVRAASQWSSPSS